MFLLSKIGGWGKKAVNQAVGVTSGDVPVPILDSPKVFSLVIIVGLIAFGLSGWLVWNSIFSAARVIPVATTNTNTTPIAAIEKLRLKDTDGDGLSDYDELYALKTSPYLADSDSDGIKDGVELSQHTDPNCPKGSTCNGAVTETGPIDTSGQLTPQFLRQALLSSGVPQNTIDQLNDSELLKIYQEATSPQNDNSNANLNSATTPSVESLKNLSAEEIRKLMVDSGMNASDLSAVDDATIKQIFQEALKQGTASQ